MATKFLDLSGRKGLAKRFQGNLNDTSASPNRIYLGTEGQIADGIFNPLKNYGYLSPANNKYAAITGSINSRIVATEYDSINDDAYLAEAGVSIWQLDGLADTSMTAANTLTGAGAIINDLQIYETNGIRRLFYVYTAGAPASNFTMTTFFSGSTDCVQVGGRINPVGSAEPTLSASKRGTGNSSAATLDIGSITVPAGSNQMGIALFFNYTATAVSSATWNGSAMTAVSTGSTTVGSLTLNRGIFKIVAPTTGSVVGTYAAATVDRIGYAYVFDGTHQTTPYTTSTTAADTEIQLSQTITISAAYQLPLTHTFTFDFTHTVDDGQTEVFNASNGGGAAGRDSSSYFSMQTPRLRVGIASLPFASATDDWMNTVVAGAFLSTPTTNNNFMVVADNGFAYLFSENHVHKIDGAATGGLFGTVTEDVLLFPSYFKTVDAVDTRGKMYIGVQANPVSGDEDVNSYSEGIVGIYVWDRASIISGTRDFIPLYGVRDIKKVYVDPSGDVRVICIGDDRFTQIRSISAGYGKIIETLGISAYPEERDGLKVMNNMVTWLGADGIMYLHGKLTPNDSEEIYKIGTIAGEVTGAFTTGAIFVGNSESTQSRQAVILSFTDATPGSEVLKWYPHGEGTISSVAQTGAQGDVYTQVVPLPAMSTVKNITINNFPTANSAATTIATVKIYFNQSTTAFKSHTVTQAMANKGYVSIECNKPFVNSVQVEIEYSTSQTLGTDDFNPMFCVIDYVPPADVVK